MGSIYDLGPTSPPVDPGKPVPRLADGQGHAANSPVEVTVNGKAAPVISTPVPRASPVREGAVPRRGHSTLHAQAAEALMAIGWPGMTNVYRVDFRVPEGTAAGTATLGLSVAWISGPEVTLPVR